VVREECVYGYVVACSDSGLECFMLPIEGVLADIETVTGMKPELPEAFTYPWPPKPVVRHLDDIGTVTGMKPELPKDEHTYSWPPKLAWSQDSVSRIGLQYDPKPDSVLAIPVEGPTPPDDKIGGDSDIPNEPHIVESPRPIPARKPSLYMESVPPKNVDITYRVELFQPEPITNSAYLWRVYEYDKPIETSKGQNLEVDTSVLQVTTCYAASNLSQVLPDNESSLPPAYYDPKNPIKVNAKLRTTIHVRSTVIAEALQSLVFNRYHLTYENGALVFTEPFCLLFHHEEDLKRLANDQSSTEEERSHANIILDFLSGQFKSEMHEERLRYDRRAPCCTFNWLWMLFRPGTVVYAWQDGKRVACMVESFTLVGLDDMRGFTESQLRDFHFGDRLQEITLKLFTMEFDGEFIGRRPLEVVFWPFQGEKTITSLPAYPASYADEDSRRDSIQRGKLYWRLTQRQYCGYNGTTLSAPGTLSAPKRTLRGRVIVDMQTYYETEGLGISQVPRLMVQQETTERDGAVHSYDKYSASPDAQSISLYRKAIRTSYERVRFRNEQQMAPLVDPGAYFEDTGTEIVTKEVSDAMYMISGGQIYGFVLGENRWGESLPFEVA
jgi:hypothetical protein